nr:uncharacterized protein LOC124816838 [Hydra vulgaris]
MTRFDREALAKRIVTFYENCSSDKKKLTYKHFKNKGIPKSTIFSILARYENYNDLVRSGCPPKMDKKKVKRLTKMLNNSTGISQKYLASYFKVNQNTISRTINFKTDIKCYKKQKVPLYEKDQQQRPATTSRRLVNKVFHEKNIITDDEKYFNLSNSNIPGNDIYYTNNKLLAPDNVKYKLKKKFEEKVLVWICISSNRFCETYIHRSKNSVTSNIYVKECMKKSQILHLLIMLIKQKIGLLIIQ